MDRWNSRGGKSQRRERKKFPRQQQTYNALIGNAYWAPKFSCQERFTSDLEKLRPRLISCRKFWQFVWQFWKQMLSCHRCGYCVLLWFTVLFCSLLLLIFYCEFWFCIFCRWTCDQDHQHPIHCADPKDRCGLGRKNPPGRGMSWDLPAMATCSPLPFARMVIVKALKGGASASTVKNFRFILWILMNSYDLWHILWHALPVCLSTVSEALCGTTLWHSSVA